MCECLPSAPVELHRRSLLDTKNEYARISFSLVTVLLSVSLESTNRESSEGTLPYSGTVLAAVTG